MKNESYEKTASAIISALLYGKGLKHLLDILCDLLENPVILCKPESNWFIYASKYRMAATDIQSILTTGTVPPNYQEEHKKYTRPELHSKKPFLLDQGLFAESRRIVSGIHIHDEVAAILAVIESNRPFKPEDYKIVEFISDVLAEELRTRGTPQSALYEYQFQKLLQGEKEALAQIDNWTTSLGWKENSAMRLCVVTADADLRYSLESSFRTIYGKEPYVKLTRLDSFIILLINCDSNQYTSDYFDRMERHLIDLDVRAIVSPPFYSHEHLNEQYRCLCDALDSGILLLREESLLWYEKLRLSHLLCSAFRDQRLQWFVSPKIQRLKEYDEQYKTDYYTTLDTYLKYGSKEAVLNALHIHKNTLNYRLGKIEEIAGIDLKDNTEQLAMQLSVCAEECLEKLRE